MIFTNIWDTNFLLSVSFPETNKKKQTNDQSQLIGSGKYATANCDNWPTNVLPFPDDFPFLITSRLNAKHETKHYSLTPTPSRVGKSERLCYSEETKKWNSVFLFMNYSCVTDRHHKCLKNRW